MEVKDRAHIEDPAQLLGDFLAAAPPGHNSVAKSTAKDKIRAASLTIRGSRIRGGVATRTQESAPPPAKAKGHSPDIARSATQELSLLHPRDRDFLKGQSRLTENREV